MTCLISGNTSRMCGEAGNAATSVQSCRRALQNPSLFMNEDTAEYVNLTWPCFFLYYIICNVKMCMPY